MRSFNIDIEKLKFLGGVALRECTFGPHIGASSGKFLSVTPNTWTSTSEYEERLFARFGTEEDKPPDERDNIGANMPRV
jgi:hypothetical protein